MYPKVCNVSKYLVHCALPPLASMEAESSHLGVKAFMPSFLKTDSLTFLLDIFYYFQFIKFPMYLHLIFKILQFEISSLVNLIFQSISNLNFRSYRRPKNSVQTRKRIQFIKLDIQTGEFQKLSANM